MKRKMVAIEDFHYDGRDLKVDDPFEATPMHRYILRGLGRAKDAEPAGAPDEEKREEKPEKRRRYRRCDMSAES